MAEFQSVWEWQIALYLFLGGLAAGAFVTGAFLYFTDLKKHTAPPVTSIPGAATPQAGVPAQAEKAPSHELPGLPRLKSLCAIAWLSTLFLVVGLLLLLTDLSQPARGIMLWQSFSNGTSWMTVGAWCVLGATIVFGVTALGLTVLLVSNARGKRVSLPAGLFTALFSVGAALALVVAAYTGILLMSAEGIAFWGSALLPALFTVSALGTGIALSELVLAFVERGEGAAREKSARWLKILALVLVAVEACVLGAYLLGMLGQDGAAAASAQLLVSGDLSGSFWSLVVACALAVPFVCALASFALRGRVGEIVAACGAIGALVGGCSLRFLILSAGAHGDIVLDAVTKLIS